MFLKLMHRAAVTYHPFYCLSMFLWIYWQPAETRALYSTVVLHEMSNYRCESVEGCYGFNVKIFECSAGQCLYLKVRNTYIVHCNVHRIDIVLYVCTLYVHCIVL